MGSIDYFNKLPDELILIIFKKLNISDLRNLRTVNRRFKGISEFSTTDLIVTNGINLKNFWYLSDDRKSADRDDLIFCGFWSFRKIFRLESSLKRLELSIFIHLSSLNRFKHLEHLEIDVFSLEGNDELNLLKLKLLVIKKIFYTKNDHKSFCTENEDHKLILECKKLEIISLGIIPFKDVKIVYPKIVKYLRFEHPAYCAIEQFKNLEHLSLIGNSALDKEILTKLKRLKILDFDYVRRDDDELNDYFSYVLKQRLVLRRVNLIIRANGVEIDKESMLKDRSNSFRFQIQNYDKLTGYLFNIAYINNEEYDYLVKHFHKKVPLSFFKKFFNIQNVFFKDLKSSSQDQCSWFLDNLVSVKELKIVSCKFGQLFYNKLGNYRYLNRLELIDIEEDDDDDYGLFAKLFNANSIPSEYSKKTDCFEPKIKIDCIDLTKKLKNLVFLNVEMIQENPFEAAIETFKQSKHLKTFEFRFKNVHYFIEKFANDCYKLHAATKERDLLISPCLNSTELICFDKIRFDTR